MSSHKHTGSVSQNQKAQLATAYNELGRELSSHKVRVVGNYTLGKVIGEGAYGKVRMGTHRLTSTRVALKQIPKAMSAALTREIHHHRQLHHPHITQMYEVIATESSVWIVTELCSGGELFDYLVEKGRLSEEETKIMFGQLCLAVAYLHGKGIVHRDLKLENVLLDERCRVKLGDFGFTREFERGTLMETFCGTTGYASPEMLQGKKYQGPEVDVWSLGIILYCLLTGTLPFDDDDESVMRDKIILGEFEDPEWLSLDARDLIKGILVMDTANRLTIPQILDHSWFKSAPTYQEESTMHLSPNDIPSPRTPSPPPLRERTPSPPTLSDSNRSSEASSDSAFLSAYDSSPPTTPDQSLGDPFEDSELTPALHPNPSETTIGKPAEVESKPTTTLPATVVEEEDSEDILEVPSSPMRSHSNSSSSKLPPAFPTRTPARTKRRSMSSTLSDPDATDTEKTTMPEPQTQQIDFPSLLTTPAPIIFSTPLERDILNNLSALGFDLGQIVYSVLNDACDASGALWWMLKRKAERRVVEEVDNSASPSSANMVDKELDKIQRGRHRERAHVNVCTQTEASTPTPLILSRSAPQFSLVPPTPVTSARPSTPPHAQTSPTSRTLTPSSSMIAESSRSPSGSLKDGSKGRKNRSGSVSIMQRATTALEAAGLVRKKSSEAVRDDKERDKERDKAKEADRKSQHGDEHRKSQHVVDEPRMSHGSTTSSLGKLTKSPPLRPSTPPPSDLNHQPIGSPWVMPNPTSRDSSPTRVAPSVDIAASSSAPDLTPSKHGHGSHRNRANILTAFRLWFNDDRKGKRKETSASGPGVGRGRPVMPQPQYSGSVQKRASDGRSKFTMRGGKRRHRGSVSSRRSSSVNSRRSSMNSVQMVVLDSPPMMAGRRSFGAHTPNSERGDYSSRPSSVRSFSMQRHRKSPSASSADFRTGSPSVHKYHRRGGSGSSTRVVRQINGRPMHGRSNSTTSSLQSPPSSRPTSYHEFSDNEGYSYRTGSPFRSHSHSHSHHSHSHSHHSRRADSDSTPRKSTYLASKRQTGYSSAGSVGRSSWKKSWGLEPPGWQTRTAKLPVEVLSISPPVEGSSIRDVFSGPARGGLAVIGGGDESDWVDEDDDDVPYAGGLGQVAMSHAVASSSAVLESTVVLATPPPPRRKRGLGGAGGAQGGGGGGKKHGHGGGSGRASPVAIEPAPETRGGRRQLPTGRAGSAFRAPIQEEDEEEEEE